MCTVCVITRETLQTKCEHSDENSGVYMLMSLCYYWGFFQTKSEGVRTQMKTPNKDILMVINGNKIYLLPKKYYFLEFTENSGQTNTQVKRLGLQYNRGNDPRTSRFVVYFWFAESHSILSLRNIKRAPCLHSLMQTWEGVWENSKVCVNPSCRRGFTQRLSSCPKLPRVFASGYVNTASVLYFFYKIYDKAGSATETTTVPFYLNFAIRAHVYE